MLRLRTLNSTLDELGKQERRNINGLARRNADRTKTLTAAEKRIATGEKAAGQNGQGTKCGTADIKSRSGSGRRPNANGSPKVRSHTRKK